MAKQETLLTGIKRIDDAKKQTSAETNWNQVGQMSKLLGIFVTLQTIASLVVLVLVDDRAKLRICVALRSLIQIVVMSLNHSMNLRFTFNGPNAHLSEEGKA